MKQIVLLLVLLFIACNEEKKTSPLEQVLQKELPAIKNIMEDSQAYEVQIIYTQIDTDENGKAVFTDYSFNLDQENYFYPASTVKLPAAILALEYLDKTTGVKASGNYTISGDTLEHTIETDIQQIFAVSDNDAYNRLYELLGRDNINSSLRSKGISPVRISHRLSNDDVANSQRDTLFFDGGQQLGGGLDSAIETITAKNLNKGKGFIKNDSLVSEPMDFSEKNYLPLPIPTT